MRRLGELLGRWPIALVACVLLSATILLPCLNHGGLWEPTERHLADRLAPPLSVPEKPDVHPTEPDPACPRTAPEDATARSLQQRAIEFGRDTFGDDDGGRRLPFALLGLLTALAAAGIALRAGGGRAAIVTTATLLAMPLFTLQSRMLTSDIGTACGATLLIGGLLGLARPSRRHVLIDLVLSTAMVAIGIVLGFFGGGALLGLLVPIGAFAAAGAFGVPLVIDAVHGKVTPRHIVALVATVVTIVLIAILAYQIWYLVTPYPGLTPPPMREVFGKAVVPEGCWSDALGALWRPDDDIRFIFDSSFEQIAFGTFPLGIVAPIAMFGLLRSSDPMRRQVGAITLAWAAAAWIAVEVFHRKVGYAMYPGFPAFAIATGVWLDDVLSRRRASRAVMPAGAILIGLFVALGVLDLGKDLQSFTDKLTSLLTLPDVITYPKDATAILPVRLWVLVLGGLAAIGFATTMIAWRDGDTRGARMARKIAGLGAAAMLVLLFVLGAFWSFVWQPELSLHLSSKELFETYDRLQHGDRLYVMGDLGFAPDSYTSATPERVKSRAQIVAALKRPERVFAIAPQSELCSLHREMTDHPYFVLEDRNLRDLLLSNKVDGTTDKNPLGKMILHEPPTTMSHRPKARIVFDNRVELIGWDLPARIDRGDDFDVVTYWKVLAPVGGSWKMLMHFDGPLRLHDGDHEPIENRCSTSTWRPGDYIVDRHHMSTSGRNYPAAKYDLWVGFFTGAAPNFRNMRITMAPGDMRDTNDRAKIASIVLE